MSNSGSNNAVSFIDLTIPPPPMQIVSKQKNYECLRYPPFRPSVAPPTIPEFCPAQQPTLQPNIQPKIEPGISAPQRCQSSDARFPYYQRSSPAPNYAPQTRPPSQNRPNSAYADYAPAGPTEPKVVDTALFSQPPPTIPLANMTASPGGYILGNPAVPPPVISPMGSGQYHSQYPRNIRQQPFQGDYSAGYSKRGGYNNFNRKRMTPHEYELEASKRGAGSPKKKKKPLSQTMPSRKDWSLEDAKRALAVERDYCKRNKSPSLIIKFPDLEINRDIVSRFHSKIESVHFQQPSTPRFCFVTLKDSSCIDEVIRDLSKVKFGDGYLTAETKNNRDDDLVKGPEDIDPLTLYVGNLAQEVTVDDVVKAYPKHKRIDIGFAKKMKYTRYAFVCFRAVDDAIEAFQSTHSTEMYNKSIIVRFRRLHGTVGLPGDPKPQHSQKRNYSESNITNGSVAASNVNQPDQSKETPLLDGGFHTQPAAYNPPPSYGPYCSSILDEIRHDRPEEGSTDADLSRFCPSVNVSIKSEVIDYDFETSIEQSVVDAPSHVPMFGEPIIKQELEEVTVKDNEKCPSEGGLGSENAPAEALDDIDTYLSDSSF